jgi:FAD dependent oxidoreductase TIGR03364
MSPDVVVVGGGIVGMACAWAALQQGLRVVVIDRDPVCVGASIRNFGFVTVTGQGSGDTWRRARRSRDIWADLAPRAGIAVLHRGLWVLAQREEARDVLQELCAREQGKNLQWLEPEALHQRAPQVVRSHLLGALYSPHEIRIEARHAVEQLRQWLASQGVLFHMGLAVQQVQAGEVRTAEGVFRATNIAVCPGPQLRMLFPSVFERRRTRLCQLQMLRIQPPPGFRLPAAMMSDLSLIRYRGYREIPSIGRLAARLKQEAAAELAHGIHLIVVQSEDGSLVVGDSHHYGSVLPPFASMDVEKLILQEMQRMLALDHYQVLERWTGVYPSGDDDAFIETVLPGVQLISVTSGTGMSTAFALAEDWINSWGNPL